MLKLWKISGFLGLSGQNLVETFPMTEEAGYWDSQAVTFDKQPDHGLLDSRVRQAWRRLLLAELPAAPAAIADLGCGTGTLSVLLAAEGYAVTGLDFSPQMIRAARAKARAADVSARFELSNAAAPTLPAASFDVVLARHVLWAMPDIGAALAAWLRLLLPGGVLLLVEGCWSTGSGGPGVGLTACEAGRAVLRHRSDATITVLGDPALWGARVTDERYLLVSRR